MSIIERRTDCAEFELKTFPGECGDCQTEGHYLCPGCKYIADFDSMELSDNREKYYPEQYQVKEWQENVHEVTTTKGKFLFVCYHYDANPAKLSGYTCISDGNKITEAIADQIVGDNGMGCYDNYRLKKDEVYTCTCAKDSFECLMDTANLIGKFKIYKLAPISASFTFAQSCDECGKECDGLMNCYLEGDDKKICPDCMPDSGYCMRCGQYCAGIQSFDFSEMPGYCSDCVDEMKMEDKDEEEFSPKNKRK